MSIVEKAKGAPDYIKAYNNFSKEFNQILGQDEITIQNLDTSKYEDRKIALQIILRGKTVNEYFGIVDGLLTATHEAETKEEKYSLYELTSMVMSIGESNRVLIGLK